MAAKAGTDFPPESEEELLLQYLKIAQAQQCVQLCVMVAEAALATLEMQQPIRLVAKAERLHLILMAVNILAL